MIYVRSFIFNIFYFLAHILILGLGSVTFFMDRKYSVSVVVFLQSTVLFLMRHIVKIDYKVEGMENRPNTPCIFASKHQSVWDTNIFVYLIHNCISVIKKELLSIPFYGGYLKKWGTIAVDRKKGSRALVDMVNQAKYFTDNGYDICIFPEGTRSSPGAQVEYKRGIALMYEKLGVPVMPVALNSGCFWPRRGFLKYPGTITIRFLKPIQPGLNKNEFMKQMVDTIETNSMELYKEVECAK